MASISAKERQIEMTLTCGKCGSRAIASDNVYNHSAAQTVFALKCLICGNRQEEGVPCRWPFFGGETSSSMPVETGDKVESGRPDHKTALLCAEKPRKRKTRARKTLPKLAELGLSP